MSEHKVYTVAENVTEYLLGYGLGYGQLRDAGLTHDQAETVRAEFAREALGWDAETVEGLDLEHLLYLVETVFGYAAVDAWREKTKGELLLSLGWDADCLPADATLGG